MAFQQSLLRSRWEQSVFTRTSEITSRHTSQMSSEVFFFSACVEIEHVFMDFKQNCYAFVIAPHKYT